MRFQNSIRVGWLVENEVDAAPDRERCITRESCGSQRDSQCQRRFHGATFAAYFMEFWGWGQVVGDMALPPIGRPSGGSSNGGHRSPQRRVGSGEDPRRSAVSRRKKPRSSRESGDGVAGWIIVAIWSLLVLGIGLVVLGALSWRASTLNVSLHLGGAVVSFFGSVVVLARFRFDLNRKSLGGNFVQRPLQSVGLNTGVALAAWSCGILQIALVGLDASSRFGG